MTCRIDHDELRRSAALWNSLKFIGHQHVEADDTGPAETLELRDCRCGSTLSIVLAASEAA